jgi:CheY-like chemotaxis protein
MDVKMPRMNGLDATRQIRHLPRCATASIIGLTAHAYAEDGDRCLAVGMNDNLAKPIEPERLFESAWRGDLDSGRPAVAHRLARAASERLPWGRAKVGLQPSPGAGPQRYQSLKVEGSSAVAIK